jgi:pimeloyl-ACP methyl ester carboxylesterase
VVGHSLINRARALGVPILAVDRPGYGQSVPLDPAEATLLRNAEVLDVALNDFWERQNIPARGIVLIGHSIGGAIAIRVAEHHPEWPLLGIAISGVGLNPNPEDAEIWASLPDEPFLEMPQQFKDAKMFGQPGSYASSMPHASRAADAPAPRTEIWDMGVNWPREFLSVAANVNVPVHYRQAEQDMLWVVNQSEVDSFASAFSASPYVDSKIVKMSGHCIDFHKCGAAFQLEQLAFALRCAENNRKQSSETPPHRLSITGGSSILREISSAVVDAPLRKIPDLEALADPSSALSGRD